MEKPADRINRPNMLSRAWEHQQACRFLEAEEIYNSILQTSPNDANALHFLGVLRHRQGQFETAIELMRRSIDLEPRTAQFHLNLGNALMTCRDLAGAAEAYRQSLRLKTDPFVHVNLGNALKDLGQLEAAREQYERAIRLAPDCAGAHCNLGNVLKDQGQLDAAQKHLERAIQLAPDLATAHSHLGSVLKYQGQLDAAREHFERAIQLAPEQTAAHFNLGLLLQDVGRLDEAISCYRRVIERDPNMMRAHSKLFLAFLCHDRFNAADMQQAQAQWNAKHAAPLAGSIEPHRNVPEPTRRLKVGYVSTDFYLHPVSFFLLPLFSRCNHDQIELVCYSDVVTPDQMTQLLRRCADQWHETLGVSDEQLAQMIRQHQIDILVDLAGHTGNNRMLLFARKPAPVQVSYLGFAGSTGLTTIDYRLTDAWADPIGLTDRYHTEKLFRLPNCNWCFAVDEQSPDVLPPPSTRGQPICFGSFNYLAKVSSSTLQLWAALLKAVPNSRLLLKAKGFGSASAQLRIKNAFAGLGIDSSRVELRGQIPERLSHLAVYGEIDIALDTFPYHGTTTTCEALWMGVPVVTLAGNSHASRVGVSLLNNVGLPELIAHTPQQYIQIAADLAANIPRLAELRQTMRQRMSKSPLTNALQFTRNLEAAYRQMWQTWCQSPS